MILIFNIENGILCVFISRGDSNENTQHTMYLHDKENQVYILIMAHDLALLFILNSSNYPCLKNIFFVPKVFEPFKFYCMYMNLVQTKVVSKRKSGSSGSSVELRQRVTYWHFEKVCYSSVVKQINIIAFAENMYFIPLIILHFDISVLDIYQNDNKPRKELSNNNHYPRESSTIRLLQGQ